jgi:hypothetical protein
MVSNIDATGRHRRGVTIDFDLERFTQDARKFKAVPCLKEADRVFLFKAIALSQSVIPPFALWDALEAVKQIGPRIPIAYFRTVLRDNCRKAGVDLGAALKTVHLPRSIAMNVKQLEAAAIRAHRRGDGWPGPHRGD